MRIDCDQCGAAYSIDDALITERGVRAQCPKCGTQKVVKKGASSVGGNPLGAGPAPITALTNVPPSFQAAAGANPFAPPSSAAPPSNPFAPPSSSPSSVGGAGANPFAPPATANPFAPPSPPAPSFNAGTTQPNPFAPQGTALSADRSGDHSIPGGNPFAAPPSTGASRAAELSNPFGSVPPMPSQPSQGGLPSLGGNPFAAPPSMAPSMGPPIGAPGGSNPFGAPMRTGTPKSTPSAQSPFGGSLAGPDPFAAALGTPPADPFAGMAPPAQPSMPPMQSMQPPPMQSADPFAKLGASPARPAMSTGPGGAPGAAAIVVKPPEAPPGDPFASFGSSGAAADDPFDRAAAKPQSNDPFARLDMGNKEPDAPRVSEAPAPSRWQVRTKAGLDADVDLPQLRDMVKAGKVGLDDEAAPLGEPLKAVATWPILVPLHQVKSSQRVAGVASRRGGPSFGVIAAAVGVVAVVAVVAGVYVTKPEIFEKRSEAGVNPLRRAKTSWEKQFPDVGGTAAEHVSAGKAQMRLDTAAGYRKADDEFRQALLLDISSVPAIAAWVQNFTNLPAVHADQESTTLAQEAISFAKKKKPDDPEVLRADGALRLALGDVDTGQKELVLAHQAQPGNAETTLVLAASHLERSPEEALNLVQEARAKDPQMKHALVVEGAADRRLGAFKEARDVLGSRIVDDPANTGALKELAKLELDLGNGEAAIAALTKLLEAEDRDVEAHLMRAKIAYQTIGDYKRADQFLDQVLKTHDTTAGELLLPVLAHAAFVKAELGNLDEALRLGERARITDPNYAPGLFVLGRVYALKGRLDDAKKALEASLRAAQVHDQFYEPIIRGELARVLQLAGDASNAVRNYEQVIDYDPRYTRAHFGLAATYLATDKATQAMTIMRRAYENDPAYEKERVVLTDYPTPKRDLVGFADIFKQAKVPAGDESLAALKLASEGMIRYAAGQVQEAEALDKKTLVEDRFNDVALLYLGVIELGDGRAQEALKHLKLAAETTGKNHAMTRLYLVRAEMKANNLDEAKKNIQDLVDQEPTLVQAQYTQAMLARSQHLEGPASEELKKVIKADPDYTPAKRALAD